MRKIIASILRAQAKRFLKKNSPKVVVVAGSVGKTSTTQAIAEILDSKYKVIKTIANYNTDTGVPCSIFGRKFPDHLNNPVAWLFIFAMNEVKLLARSKVDVLVLEIGTDTPGEISQFAWLNPDVAVVTAVAAEHMEYFKTLEAVAEEELAVSEYSAKILYNDKMVAKKYLSGISKGKLSKYSRKDIKKYDIKPGKLKVAGGHSVDAVAAALAVGKIFDIDKKTLAKEAKNIEAMPGRMNVLPGIRDSKLIDDTYNASPEAIIAALDYLYEDKSSQRIALVGNMNELGETSRKEHLRIGEYCDPEKLDLVVTLGVEANKYSATAARASGCRVEESQTPYQAADIIKREMGDGATILLKGSQNGVFAEEATKLLLANPMDESKLVRQSAFWLIEKQKCFRK